MFLIDKLSATGASIPLKEPMQEEGGWMLSVDIDGQRFSLFVHWAPLGDPPIDFWVIQPGKQKGLFATLFGRKSNHAELEPICTLLDDVIRKESRLTNVKWVAPEEFARIY